MESVYKMKSISQRLFPMSKRLFSSLLLSGALLFFGACGQDYNSNSGDGAVSSVDCSTASAEFCAATAVLQSRCFSCHTDMAGYTTSQDYINSGRVVASDTVSSTIINRLINAGSTMPLGGSALPAAEYNALVDWVNSL